MACSSRRPIPSGRARSSSTGHTRSAATRTRTTRGRQRARSGRTGGELERMGENVRPHDDGAGRRRRVARLVRRRGRRAQPGRCPRPDPDELEGGRARGAAERAVPDARAPPHRRPRRPRRGRALPRGTHPGRALRRTRWHDHIPVDRRRPDPRRGRGVSHRRRGRLPSRIACSTTILATDLVGSTEQRPETSGTRRGRAPRPAPRRCAP